LNKKALKSTIENKGSKVIGYYELAKMSKVFDVNLSKKEKTNSSHYQGHYYIKNWALIVILPLVKSIES